MGYYLVLLETRGKYVALGEGGSRNAHRSSSRPSGCKSLRECAIILHLWVADGMACPAPLGGS